MTNQRHIVLAGFAALTFTLYGIAAAGAKPVNYQLPDDAAELKPGKNLEAVQNNCTACHSPDYFKTQPARPGLQNELLEGGGDEDDQGLRRAD